MKKKWLIPLLIVILIILLIIAYLIFGREKSFTITFDTNGGTEINTMEVKNGEIVKLPEAPKKDGHKFVGWTNKEGKVITKGAKITDNLALKAEWISNDADAKTIEFNTDGGNEIDNILIENGKYILLPIDPTKDGYIFVCWVDGNGNLVTKEMIITKNIILKAIWIKKDAKTVTVKFDTDGGNNIGSIIIENGTLIILPITPIKEGYVFAGWVDENGKTITKDTKVDKNMTIKATWKKPYNCPSGCTPIGDGKKCTKTTTKELVTYTGCPSGTETIEKFCSTHQYKTTVGFGEDETTVSAGIFCDGNPKGFCVDYKHRYISKGTTCPSGYYKYTDADGLSAMFGCAKRFTKGGSSCPSGYKKSGNVCKKTETLKCKAN